MIQCHFLKNLSLPFAFREGILIFKTISCNFIANEENADDNDQNKQALLFPCKTYDFGALGDKTFLSYVFVRPGGNSKGPFSDSLNNLE